MMNAKAIQRALQQPFAETDLEWRVQASGKFGDRVWCRILAYVTSRAIQQRLDDTLGVFGWKNEFSPLPNSVGDGALCGISIKVGDEWVTKYDGAENTNIEPIKGGLSGAMKRAAVQLGIGRYLYDIEAHYAEVITPEAFKALQRHEKDKYEKAETKDKTVFYWKPPKLDDRFLPKKLVLPATVKTIEELAMETDSDLHDICKAFGVDDVRDLYTDEAGKAVNILLTKKKRIEDAANDEKNKS